MEPIELFFKNKREEIAGFEGNLDFFAKLEKATRSFYKKVLELSETHKVPVDVTAQFSIKSKEEEN